MYDTNKKAEVTISVVMMALGLLTFFDPLGMAFNIAYVIAAGLGLYGIYGITAYIRSDKGERNAWSLSGSVAVTALALLMLWTALGNGYGTVPMLSTLTFAIGFFTLISGISKIQQFSSLHKNFVSGSELMLMSGVIDMLLTMIIFINPLISWFTMGSIWGLYLTMSGLALLTESAIDKDEVYQVL